MVKPKKDKKEKKKAEKKVKPKKEKKEKKSTATVMEWKPSEVDIEKGRTVYEKDGWKGLIRIYGTRRGKVVKDMIVTKGSIVKTIDKKEIGGVKTTVIRTEKKTMRVQEVRKKVVGKKQVEVVAEKK